LEEDREFGESLDLPGILSPPDSLELVRINRSCSQELVALNFWILRNLFLKSTLRSSK
jgi:hypothetical protein